MASEPWSGEVQRAHLSGFSRVRAILWRRSLRLYEGWALRGERWPSRLREELDRRFRGVDLDHPARLASPACTFGETPVLTTVKLLELVRALVAEPPPTFVDLGSGRGLACLVAAQSGYQAIGYEREDEWCRRAQEAAAALDLDARFRAGDFMRLEWPRPSVFFVVGTAYPKAMREELARRFGGFQGSYFLLGDWELPAPFERLWAGSLPVDWGTIPFSLHGPPA